MPALVLPVVVGRVDDTEVGGGGVVEELGNLVEGLRIRVFPPVRVLARDLGRERGELRRRLVGEGVEALGGEHLEAVVAAGEAHRTVVGPGLVRAVAGHEDHVDDGLEARVGEHPERRLGRLGPLGRQPGGLGRSVGTEAGHVRGG